MIAAYPGLFYNSQRAFLIGAERAEQAGILLIDGKFEGSADALGDERLTPDACRYVLKQAWLECQKSASGRKLPDAMDKERARIWGRQVGIDQLDPEKPEDVARVHAIVVPETLLAEVTQTYRYIPWLLTGKTVEDYLLDEMGVNIGKRKTPNIAIVCGSKSDVSVVEKAGLSMFKSEHVKIAVSVASCHRNPEEVQTWAREGGGGADVVIAVGGKAFALPGVLDAALYAAGKQVPVIGVALGEPGSQSLLAAQLSIREIPGMPVIIDEIKDEVYTGPAGLLAAINRVIYGELPPAKPRTQKPAEWGIYKNF